MTASDSLPIQFWDIDADTFNEKDVQGLRKQDCFCQPFNCDDELTLQFHNTNPLNLQFLNEYNAIVKNLPMTEVSSGIWTKTFLPSDVTECNRKWRIHVTEATAVRAPSAWADAPTLPVIGGPCSAFVTRTATQFTTNNSMGTVFVAAKLAVSIPAGVTPNPITAPISFTGTLFGTNVGMFFGNGSTVVSDAGVKSFFGVNPTNAGVFTFQPLSAAADYLYIYVDFSGDTASFAGSITVTPSYQIYAGSAVMKSDCVEVRGDHGCTNLIEYTNSSDFDGISYEDASPAPTFYLRVPGIFFQERNPMEQEDIEKSDGRIVTLRQSISNKRMLEVDFAPPWFHLKLQKVLMHETIIIDGTQWKRRDAYEDNPVNKYNQKTASVLLTKYDSVEKNTI